MPEQTIDFLPDTADAEIIYFRKRQSEIDLADNFINWSYRMGTDTRTENRLAALKRGREKMRELGAEEKAVVSAGSRRSMEYLRDHPEQNGYAGDVVCFSGGAADRRI